MQKTQISYLPAIAAAILDVEERDNAARHTFQRRALPPVELVLIGVFSAGERRRTVFRIVVDGREVGTAIEWANQPTKPWRLTMPGHCGNIVRPSREELEATVARILSSGAIWS